MIDGWIVLALYLPVPIVFVVGFLLGKHHVRHLAKHGGERRYPAFVQRTVKKYRAERLSHKEQGVTGDD